MSCSSRLLPGFMIAFTCFTLSGLAQESPQPFLKPFITPPARPLSTGVSSRLTRLERSFIRARQEALLARQGRRPALSAVRATAPGSIAGTVYESDGITPHPGFASVDAYTLHGQYAGYAFSDYSSGAYTITSLPPGDYLLQVDAPAYASTFYGDADDWRTANAVHVAENQQTAGINFALRRYSSAITGRVVGPDGSPAVGSGVSAMEDRISFTLMGFTDSAGTYTIYLPPGSYKLYATGMSDGLAPQWYGNAASFSSAPSVEVVAGDTVRGKNFSLVKGGSLSGRVTVQPGDTLESGMASVLVMNMDYSFVAQPTLDPSGVFNLSGVASGTYRIFARYYGPGNLLDTWYGGAHDEDHAATLEITAPDSVGGLVIVLPRGGSLSGTITAQGLSGVPFGVTACDRSRNYVNSVMTAADGSFLVSRLPSGSYTLMAGPSGGLSTPFQPQTMYYPGVSSFDHASFVDVVAPAVCSGLNMMLQQGGGVAGTITGPDGFPPDPAPGVYVYDKDGQPIGSGSVNANGQYTINGLPPGEARLFCSTLLRSELAAEWSDGKASFLEATPVVLTAGQQRIVAFSLEKGTPLTGFLIDSQSRRLTSEEHSIRLGIYGAATGNFFGWLDNTMLGGFEARLLPRAYKLGAILQRWNSSKTPDSLTMTFYPHGADFTDAGATPVSLQAGVARDLSDFTLDKAPGAVTGTIYYGTPARPVTSGTYFVLAFTPGGFIAGSSGYDESYGALDGSYRIGGLRPGTYHLLALVAPAGAGSYTSATWYDQVSVPPSIATSVIAPAIPQASKPVTVGGGAVPGIDFRVGSTTAVTGTPGVAGEYRLEQNFPNPFNPSTTIQFSTPRRSHLTLTVFNTLGQQVAELVNADIEAGYHSVQFNAGTLASGVYFYRLKTGSFVDVKKLCFVR